MVKLKKYWNNYSLIRLINALRQCLIIVYTFYKLLFGTFVQLAILTSHVTLSQSEGEMSNSNSAYSSESHSSSSSSSSFSSSFHKQEEYWKEHLGENTKMPKAIKDSLNGIGPTNICFFSKLLLLYEIGSQNLECDA